MKLPNNKDMTVRDREQGSPSGEIPVINLTLEDMMAVPRYGNTSPANQEIMERIVNNFDFSDPQAAKNFGVEAINLFSEFVDETHKTLMDANFSFMDNPLSKITAAVNSENIKQVARRVEIILGRATGSLLINKLTIAFFKKAHLISEQKAQDLQNGEIRDLSHQLQDAYLDYQPLIKDVRRAAERIPGIVEKVDTLGPMNMRKLGAINMFIGAGNEIMERYRTVLLETDRSDLEHYNNTNNAMQAFSRQMAVLRASQSTAAELIFTYNSQSATLKDVASTLESIANCEVHDYKQRLVALDLGLQTLGATAAATAFRTANNVVAKATHSATELAAQRAREARVDSPENLRMMLDNLNAINQLVVKAERGLPIFHREQQRLVEQLTDARNSILEAEMRRNDGILPQEKELAKLSSKPASSVYKSLSYNS